MMGSWGDGTHLSFGMTIGGVSDENSIEFSTDHVSFQNAVCNAVRGTYRNQPTTPT